MENNIITTNIRSTKISVWGQSTWKQKVPLNRVPMCTLGFGPFIVTYHSITILKSIMYNDRKKTTP